MRGWQNDTFHKWEATDGSLPSGSIYETFSKLSLKKRLLPGTLRGLLRAYSTHFEQVSSVFPGQGRFQGGSWRA